MIRIFRTQVAGTTELKAEGKAVGAFGEELVRVIEDAVRTTSHVNLDLGALLVVDQPTLEFLARIREKLVITGAPRYLAQSLEGLCEPEGGAPPVQGGLDSHGIFGVR